MKLAQTNLSKLRGSDIFVENRSLRGSQLRRSGIFDLPGYAAPTELNGLLGALATNMPLLRSWKTGRTVVAPACAGARASARFTGRQREPLGLPGAVVLAPVKPSQTQSNQIFYKITGSAPNSQGNESQRDSGSKPKVARHALPWVNEVRVFPNPNGVVAIVGAHSPQPLWGWRNFHRLTQGSACRATLGWRTQSLRDCQRN